MSRAPIRWQPLAAVGLACAIAMGCMGPSVDDNRLPITEAATAALTDGEPASSFSGVGRLILAEDGQEGACTGALVGAETILTAAHCISTGSSLRQIIEFRLGGSSYEVESPSVAPPLNYEARTLDFGSGQIQFPKVPLDDIVALQLLSTPPPAIERLSVSSSAGSRVTGPFILLGTTADGDPVKTEHQRVVLTTDTTLWFESDAASSESGGYVEKGDSGGPTVVSGPQGHLIVGVHHARHLGGNEQIPNPVSVDMRVDSFISTLGSDVCVDGRHPDDSVQCTGTVVGCGNGRADPEEPCDDGNSENGDGCSSSCSVELGFDCTGARPSVCTPIGGTSSPSECGDGRLDDDEVCDDGDNNDGDGCSDTCRTESGYDCSGSPSQCERDTTRSSAAGPATACRVGRVNSEELPSAALVALGVTVALGRRRKG